MKEFRKKLAPVKELATKGCRYLAGAVIRNAVVAGDLYFIDNGLDYYVRLMNGGKDDYQLKINVLQKIQEVHFGMKIEKAENYEKVTDAVKRNGGYCPCKVEKAEYNRCICREFLMSDKLGNCQCGRYKKVQV